MARSRRGHYLGVATTGPNFVFSSDAQAALRRKCVDDDTLRDLGQAVDMARAVARQRVGSASALRRDKARERMRLKRVATACKEFLSALAAAEELGVARSFRVAMLQLQSPFGEDPYKVVENGISTIGFEAELRLRSRPGRPLSPLHLLARQVAWVLTRHGVRLSVTEGGVFAVAFRWASAESGLVERAPDKVSETYLVPHRNHVRDAVKTLRASSALLVGDAEYWTRLAQPVESDV